MTFPDQPTIGAPAPDSAGGYNFFSYQAPRYGGGGNLPRGVRYRSERIPKTDVAWWEVEIWDLRGGLNRTVGDFDADWDRSRISTLDTRFYRTLCLPQLTTEAATPDLSGNLAGMHSQNIFGTLIIGSGSGANVSLLKETSATDPTIAAITYTPPAAISCLSSIVQGGATAATELLVGFTGANSPVTLTDASASAGTTGNASLRPLWGHIQTPINDRTSLFYANGGVWTLPATSAISAAPTQVLTSVPNGGYALGLLRHGGGPLRAYWVWPYANNTSGILLFGSETQGRVVTTNLEGIDPQDVDFGFSGGVLQAAIIPSRSAIIATDGNDVVLHDGKSIQRYNIFSDRIDSGGTDQDYKVRGFWVDDPQVYVVINRVKAANGVATAYTRYWVEALNLDTGAVHTVSYKALLNVTPALGVVGVLGAGALPFSKQNGFMHTYRDGKWSRLFSVPSGVNAYSQYSQTSGAASTTGRQFENNGRWTSPYWELPGLKGLPKIASEVVCLGDVNSMGTAATAGYIDVEVQGASDLNNGLSSGRPAHFITGLANQSQHIRFTDNQEIFYQMAVYIDMQQTSASTYFTGNALPIIIRGYAYLNPAAPSNEAMQAMKSEMLRWG